MFSIRKTSVFEGGWGGNKNNHPEDKWSDCESFLWRYNSQLKEVAALPADVQVVFIGFSLDILGIFSQISCRLRRLLELKWCLLMRRIKGSDDQMYLFTEDYLFMIYNHYCRAKWRIENIRRRHNYLPLIMELLRWELSLMWCECRILIILLRSLATRGELVPIYQKAKEKAAEAEKRKKEKGKAWSIFYRNKLNDTRETLHMFLVRDDLRNSFMYGEDRC